MTKIQQREVEQARKAVCMGMTDYAARSVSALIRSAMRKADREELLQAAQDLGLDASPEFII